MLKRLVQEYESVHLTLGVIGNVLFFAGSILFYRRFEPLYTAGVTLFVVGSLLMFLGSLGSVLKVAQRDAAPDDDARRARGRSGP